MNVDENVRKLLIALLRKWHLLVIFTIIGVLAGYFYTSNFTSPTYTSTTEFMAQAIDKESEMPDSETNQEISSESARISQTSKLNYAMKMIDTYIEIMGTNDFNSRIADELNKRINSDYSSDIVKNSIAIENVENTAMFKVTVTTIDADLSYEIAHQLEITIPKMIDESSSGLVNAKVMDKPVKASAEVDRGYFKKCLIAGAAGFVLAAAYIILRSLLDVRIRNSEELVEAYGIPILANIPNFEGKNSQKRSGSKDIYKLYSNADKGVENDG